MSDDSQTQKKSQTSSSASLTPCQKAKRNLAAILEAADTGGKLLKDAIRDAGGPEVSLHDSRIGNTIAAAVNWRYGPNMQGRSQLTETERSLVMAVDELTREDDQ